MIPQKDRIEAAIRHIQTSADIDPWAMELAVDALKAQGTCGDAVSRQAAIDRAVSIPMFGRDVKMVAVSEIKNLPSAQPENIIQQFRDYQVEWLTSHCDLELEPTLEEWIVRFLNDTAECFELEGRING